MDLMELDSGSTDFGWVKIQTKVEVVVQVTLLVMLPLAQDLGWKAVLEVLAAPDQVVEWWHLWKYF